MSKMFTQMAIQKKGKNPFFTLCPYCKTTVSTKKNKTKPLQSVQVGDRVRTTIAPSNVIQHED